jgi:outer membrane protein assembly factor BamD
MSRRFPAIVLLGSLLLIAACTNKKVQNPLANVGSKQPDKVLFDRAMDALKHNRFDVARMTLETLINTYPDSEYVARAKLAVADSWYDEGGSTAFTQAEIQYKDFITFFPNMPEAAEAQFKIANIHYQQMEKSDRDPTHALRAEEEYRQMILQFPDSKLVPEAKQRLLEVEEVLAEREFNVGRFYYLKQSYPAAIARLKSVVDKYPLYSRADEALYTLGQAYEGEVAMLRLRKINETQKARMIEQFNNDAADAYARVITRYPIMDYAAEARKRLEALHRPVPKPTKAAVAQNKAEDESRHGTGMFGHLMGNFNKHPDVAAATKIGDPTLVDPKETSATEVVQEATRAMAGPVTGSESSKVEIVGTGEPPKGEAAPRSDGTAPANPAVGTPSGQAVAQPPVAAAAAASNTPNLPANNAAPQPGELTPNVPQNSNELAPNVGSDGSQSLPPPTQVNELQNGASTPGGQAGTATPSGSPADTASSGSKQADQLADDSDLVSSSKHKKKKGIHKVVPF